MAALFDEIENKGRETDDGSVMLIAYALYLSEMDVYKFLEENMGKKKIYFYYPLDRKAGVYSHYDKSKYKELATIPDGYLLIER
jgi:hypothetical protein